MKSVFSTAPTDWGISYIYGEMVDFGNSDKMKKISGKVEPSWLGCRLHRLHLWREVRTQSNIKLHLKLWGMWSTPLLPLFPHSL